MSENRCLKAALDYVERDFALLPVRPRTKEPHHQVLKEIYGSTSWTPLRDRRASRPEIEAWFRADPETSIGIISGSASEGLAVLDVDRDPVDLRLPATPTVRTGRGRHLYFRSERQVASNTFDWGELRAGGQYVVAPPSMHESGVTYEFISGHALEDLPIVELPLDWLEFSRSAPKADVSKVYLADPEGEDRRDWADLRKWDADSEFVRAASRLIGLPEVDLGKKFCCVLPGHEEEHPSAALWQEEDGIVLYRDFHAATRGGTGQEALTLATVYAAVTTGKLRKLSPAEHAAWKLKLLKETDSVEQVPVEAQPAPPDLRPLSRKLYQGYLEVLGLHWALDKPGSAIPFTWQFAATWCGCSERHIGEAMKILLKEGLIYAADHELGPFGKPMALFLPGQRRRPSRSQPQQRPRKGESSRHYLSWGGLTSARSIA